jgi:hypothetical protein
MIVLCLKEKEKASTFFFYYSIVISIAWSGFTFPFAVQFLFQLKLG